MAETFPTAETLFRSIKEGIPRDWFAFLDIQGSESFAVIRRLGERQPVPYTSPGPEISPAVVQALLAPKVCILLPFILSVVASTRLATAQGTEVDSWAFQFFGDFLPRLPGEQDCDYKRRIECLIHREFNGEQFFFLPCPTENGLAAFLDCFGFDVTVAPTLPTGPLVHGFAWGSEVVDPPPGADLSDNQPNGYRAEDTLPAFLNGDAEDMLWSGSGANIQIIDPVDEDQRTLAKLLVRKGKVFGVTTETFFV